jgi:hypothetical protein
MDAQSQSSSSSHGQSKFELNDLPPAQEWPNRPIFVRPSSLMKNQAAKQELAAAERSDAPQLNKEPVIDIHKDKEATEYMFFSKYFVGKANFLVKGISGCPEEYFKLVVLCFWVLML